MIYKCSAERMFLYRRNAFLSYIFAIFFSFSFALLTLSKFPDYQRDQIQIRMTVVAIGGALLMFFMTQSHVKRMRLTELEIMEKGLVRRDGTRQEPLDYQDIVKVSITRHTDGKIRRVKVDGRSLNLDLFGFEKMDEIGDSIQKVVSPETPVVKKFDTWNRRNLAWYFLFYGLGYFTFCLIYFVGLGFMGPIIQVGLAIYILVAKPMTRGIGAKLAVFERIFAIVLSMLAIYELYIMLPK
jgi:hypothetical protein